MRLRSQDPLHFLYPNLALMPLVGVLLNFNIKFLRLRHCGYCIEATNGCISNRDVSHQSLCIPLIVDVYFRVALELWLFILRNSPSYLIMLYVITYGKTPQYRLAHYYDTIYPEAVESPSY